MNSREAFIRSRARRPGTGPRPGTEATRLHSGSVCEWDGAPGFRDVCGESAGAGVFPAQGVYGRAVNLSPCDDPLTRPSADGHPLPQGGEGCNQTTDSGPPWGWRPFPIHREDVACWRLPMFVCPRVVPPADAGPEGGWALYRTVQGRRDCRRLYTRSPADCGNTKASYVYDSRIRDAGKATLGLTSTFRISLSQRRLSGSSPPRTSTTLIVGSVLPPV